MRGVHGIRSRSREVLHEVLASLRESKRTNNNSKLATGTLEIQGNYKLTRVATILVCWVILVNFVNHELYTSNWLSRSLLLANHGTEHNKQTSKQTNKSDFRAFPGQM